MKRLFIILSTVLLAFILISCTQKSFTVTFNSQGGTEVISQTVQSGKFATKPTGTNLRRSYIQTLGHLKV